MPQTVQPAYQTGQLVTQVSMQAVQDAARNLVGSALAAVLGINNANTMDLPFTVTAAGGMVVTAGGAGGEKILVNSGSGPRLVDAVPTQSFTVPAANGSNPRHDIIYGVYAQTQVLASTSGQIATLSGSTITVSTGNIYNATEAITYTYVTGTAASSPTDPAGPTNSVALARIIVPTAATSIVTGNITVLLSTMQSQILAGVSGFVDLVSNQTVGGNKTLTGTTTIGGIQFKNTDTVYSGVAGIRLNVPGSIVISPISPGNGIYLGYDCSTLASINFGPLNNWGYVGSDGFHSPGNTSVYGTNATLTGGILHVGGSSNAIGQVGDGVFERNGPSGVTFLGNTGAAYLYFDGSNYNLGPSTDGQANLNVPGVVSASFGFAYPNSGSQTNNGFTFGNNSNVGGLQGLTGIGSSGVAVNSVVPVILNIANVNVNQLLALDAAGNLGVAGGLYASSLHITGGISISGSTVPATFQSSDGSIVIGQSGSTLNLTLPSGIITSYSTDGSVLYAQTGRTLEIYLNSGFCSSFTSDGSVNFSVSGRTLNVTLPISFTNIYTTPNGTMSIVQPSGTRNLQLDVFRGLTYANFAQTTAATIASAGSPYSITTAVGPLPGNSGKQYKVYAAMNCDTAGGGSQSLTGSGASWFPAKTVTDQGNSAQIVDLYGIAVGGQSPSVTWTLTGGLGSSQYVGVLQIYAYAI